MKPYKSSIGRARLAFGTVLKLLLLVIWTTFGPASSQASTDYGPAVWRPVYPGHWYTSGYGHKFHVIHDIEGYYLSAISYFQKSTTQASVHYWVNGKKDYASDANAGEVSQSVRDSYYAWHARCWNQHSTGTEHEGFVSNPAWFTEALYVASAGVTKHVKNKFGWAMDRNHVIGHDQKRISGWSSYASANLGVSGTCNDHTDPGAYWNWTHYMDLCKGTVSTPSGPSALTAAVVSASQLKLTWVDNSGIESGFKIERATATAGPWTQVGTVAANIKTYTAGSLASGTRYYFRVRAYNATGNSPYSNVANAVTKDTIPSAPTALTATAVSNDQINLAWAQSMANEDGFRVYRSADGTNYTLVATVGINVTTHQSTGLLGNRKYWFRVAAYNTAGNSAYSNVASDTTAPHAPTALAATVGATYSQVNLSWTDNANSEVGFKIERGTAAAGPFTQIATNAASVRTYTDTGRAAMTAYYYRVRSYNANGNSDYSNVASITTPNAPPILATVGDKTVAANSSLAFTVTASDPNASVVTTTFATFEGSADGTQELMFRKPANSSTTLGFIDTAATNYSTIKTGMPAGGGGTKAVKAGWNFKTGTSNYWVRFNTFGAPSWANPTIGLDQVLRFKIHSSKALKVGIGVRETSTSAAYGQDGGTTGSIEWVGVTNVVGGNPEPNRAVAANTWTTLTFNIPFEPQAAFTGDGKVLQTGAKGTLEEIILKGNGGTGAYTVWIDDIAVVAQNTLTYSLDAGAPAGATIERRTGKFAWTPTTGQVGNYNITVRVTDQLGAGDFETIAVTVTGTGNSAPVLATIGNKSVSEGSALTFTATATDANAGQTRTFSLDSGAPAGSSINASSGAFTWAPTEAQGPGSFPITVRVTDNGSPVSNDFETITVTVNEVNTAPVVATIASQSVTEGSLLSVAASATDADIPANTLTYSLAPGAPAGMTINSGSGAISWTPTEAQGPDVYPVTVTAKDNGAPNLSSSKSFNVTVNEANIAPVLNVNTTIVTVDPITDFETDEDGSYNGTVMFRQPLYSSSTVAHLDSTPNDTSIEISPNFPDPDANISSKVLHANFSFATGTTNPWLRLTTYATAPNYSTPNPAINLGQRVRFDIYTDKALKVALGIRETGTSAPIGGNGGTSGALEWVGATLNGSSPNPTRTVAAGGWAKLEFNLPAETIAAFPGSGNGVLASGKGVLEHLALVPAGGTGAYNVYLDNFEVVTITTNLVVDTFATLTFTNTASDADLPVQNLTFSLDSGAPAGAEIDPVTGVFSWSPTPAQSPSTNVVTIRVTDDGTGLLSDTENVTIIVNKVNTAPLLSGLPDHALEATSGQTVTFTASATDEDVPADTLTFSLVGSVPTGATINPATGDFSWTPPSGNSTNTITVRVTDNGVPPLYEDQTVTIMVLPANAAPVLNLGVARVVEPAVDFETFTNDTPNEYVMFKKPGNSSTTTNYVDLAVTNYTTVTTNFPVGHASAKVLKAGWTFKTGTSNYWVRLTTFNTAALPNPTINLEQRLKFDIYTSKSLKVGVGVRESGTSAAIGANGGTTGDLEYVGVSGKVGTTPIPTRTVAANTWTTLEFDLPNEPAEPLTGDGILAAGKGTLEHLILVGNGGTGAHTVYVDNFEVVTTTALPGTITMNEGSILTVTATATDSDVPSQIVSFGLDADANPNAVLNRNTGVFTWSPTTGDVGTYSFTINAEDEPMNGAIPKSDEDTFTVVVTADAYGVQATDGQGYVASGETVALSWDAVVGQSHVVQYKNSIDDAEWTTLETVTATDTTASTIVSSESERFYRIVPVEDENSASAE